MEYPYSRRRFLGTAVMTLAAAQLGVIGHADAQSNKINGAAAPAMTPGTHTSFGSLKTESSGKITGPTLS